jgi:hypothetical protein
MMFAIAALYNNVTEYQVKFTNGLSEAFGGDTGVIWQGCPLSPFWLFGVFVEMLHKRIHAQHPTEGPTFDYSKTRCMCHYCFLLMMLQYCHTRHRAYNACCTALPTFVMKTTLQ